MRSLNDFLNERAAAGGFATEDLLVSFLPLLKQVIDEHENGHCAPLEGLNDLHVEDVRIWYSEGQRQEPKLNPAALRKLDPSKLDAVEVVHQHRADYQVDGDVFANLAIADREAEVTKPVYLPGYVNWEQLAGHHDPLTDVFSLGMILAAMACNLDFNDQEALKTFVENRHNLFAIQSNLHPVIAKAIVRMTELSRHKRIQNLPSVLSSLENYREQEVDIEYDLARIKGFESSDPQTKQQIVLQHLNERLFEISRRNRLLHFKPSMQTVNLTESSVPLSFSPEHIRRDQILTWSGAFRDDIRKGNTISLNSFLNFNEILYLPGVLDRIRLEAQRDRAEYGFEQLRLVLCFLNWANVKEQPPERFHSPLILLPVRLLKKKGIRDKFTLEPLSDHAEVNPVIRHQFKQLYGIDLPEQLDLTETDLDAFFDYLHQHVTAGAPGITLNKIDRPRIDLLFDDAKRRLESYRRRARLSGRGIRHYQDLDYSYDRANFHPLGIRLFSQFVRSRETSMDSIIADTPAPRHLVAPMPEPTKKKEKRFYSLSGSEESNPWVWEFDLCNVTLGNFRYRKMTLVRDYTELQEKPKDNIAFEATFSLSPREFDDTPDLETPAVEERYDVVPCDPTQAQAIALARNGDSYIIQGPPGTGKSQTITNLIADYVARGKRVLFVCEKRAAIDVVYLRLKQCGLDDLCSLIHDSQADKKAFVMELKGCYEGLLAAHQQPAGFHSNRRNNLLSLLNKELRPLRNFNDAMLEPAETCGTEVRKVLTRAATLHDDLPELTPLERERLPHYSIWLAHRAKINQLIDILRDIQPDGILAHHPLHLLNGSIAEEEHPLEFITSRLDRAEEVIEQLLEELPELLPDDNPDYRDVQAVFAYAATVAPLARQKLLPLLDDASELSNTFRTDAEKRATLSDELAEKEQDTTHWKDKLNAKETDMALDQAKTFTGIFKVFNPAWWRLRGMLKRSYDFSAHRVRPTWTAILEELQTEHTARKAVDDFDQHIIDTYHIEGSIAVLNATINDVKAWLTDAPEAAQSLHAQLLEDPDSHQTVAELLRLAPHFEQLQTALGEMLSEYENNSLEDLEKTLAKMRGALDELPEFLACLGQLAQLDSSLAAALRNLPHTARQLEAAIADRTADETVRSDRRIHRFSGKVRNRQTRRIHAMVDKLDAINAQVVKESVQEQFLEHMRIASMPPAGMTDEQKTFKKSYNSGRRELEHEFGKSMRYKSIRDLVAGDSGIVARDLKPIWLMSPLSVSDTLPLNENEFDVVIFDEASQITLEEAVPSIFRARQAIVVGDEMQLPPTNFFSAKRHEDEETLLFEDDGQAVEYDLDSNSFLNHAARNLPSRMLGWHYRSRSEALISFSNWAFYQGGLLTVPEEQLPGPRREELLVSASDDAATHYGPMLERALSFHYVNNGVYEKRCNRKEADYIAHLVRAILLGERKLSIGIIAFSEAQQSEINSALARLARDDREFRALYEMELEREDDGQFVGLLVKNLENIQGDERDIVIMSVCYGPDTNGKMRMNFGPINQSGGEKRLNVAFSRSKHHMVLVSSIRHHQITNEYNEGANCLKNYLRYVELSSNGDQEAATRVLHELSLYADPEQTNRRNEVVIQQIADALQQRGWIADIGIGMSRFQCDIGLRKEDAHSYQLGIQVDTDAYYAQHDLIERDLMKPKLLQNFGWNIAQVLTADWYRDRDAVLTRLEKLLNHEPDPEAPRKTAIDLDALLAEKDLEPELEIIPETATNGELDPGETHRYEYRKDGSAKFWTITLVDNEFSVQYGKIGSNGHTRTKSFPTPKEAHHEAQKLTAQKLRKGYELTSENGT